MLDFDSYFKEMINPSFPRVRTNNTKQETTWKKIYVKFSDLDKPQCEIVVCLINNGDKVNRHE